jgi:CRISPR-associated protein Csh2
MNKNNKETIIDEKILDSELIFIYDAKMCNPNGDPDEENKPRMDYLTNKNLVSDVRLKRYIRDYLQSKNYEIWISKVEDKVVDATTRFGKLAEQYKKTTGKKVDIKELDEDFLIWLLDTLIDVRLFGATMPIKGGESRGGGLNFTGPIQFTWGYSLNPVEIIPSASITSTFAGRGEEYGTIGKDWRVYYSLLAFYGIISSKRAVKTRLKVEDIFLFDNALIEAIISESTTRSKIGQTPRLLIRIEYNKGNFIGDLRRYIQIKPKEGKNIDNIRDITDFEMDISNLYEILKSNKDRINRIYIWYNNELVFANNELKSLLNDPDLKDIIKNLPHNNNEVN